MSAIQLPEHILSAARSQAEQRGVSVEDWVTVTIAGRLDSAEAAAEFFRNRAKGARRGGLREALDAVPDRAADPGDEL
jgi:hypothetical protein